MFPIVNNVRLDGRYCRPVRYLLVHLHLHKQETSKPPAQVSKRSLFAVGHCLHKLCPLGVHSYRIILLFSFWLCRKGESDTESGADRVDKDFFNKLAS